MNLLNCAPKKNYKKIFKKKIFFFKKKNPIKSGDESAHFCAKQYPQTPKPKKPKTPLTNYYYIITDNLLYM